MVKRIILIILKYLYFLILVIIFYLLKDGGDATEETQLASEQLDTIEAEDAFYINPGAMLTPVSDFNFIII